MCIRDRLFYVRHRRRAGAVRIAFVLPMLVPSIVTILIWKFLYLSLIHIF